MGPKHKGFPMTQSIHFDQEEKGLGLTPIRDPLKTVIIPFCFENLNWDLYYKQRPKNCIFTKMGGANTLRDAHDV